MHADASGRVFTTGGAVRLATAATAALGDGGKWRCMCRPSVKSSSLNDPIKTCGVDMQCRRPAGQAAGRRMAASVASKAALLQSSGGFSAVSHAALRSAMSHPHSCLPCLLLPWNRHGRITWQAVPVGPGPSPQDAPPADRRTTGGKALN